MIRDLSPDDREIFLSMAKSFYSSAAVTNSIDIQIIETTFDMVIDKSPFIRAFIIDDNGCPAGYALLSFSYSPEVGGMSVCIEELFFREEYRGKGLGGSFLQFLEKEYPSAKRFRLDVKQDNIRAIDLYHRHGFSVSDYQLMIRD